MKKENRLLKLYGKLRKLFDKPNLTELPQDLIDKSESEYSKYINSFPYKSDKIYGLIDKTSSITHFLDTSIKSDRDCDDFARMWSAWLVNNGYTAIEVIITNPKHFFSNSHFITIGCKDGKFRLYNYRSYGSFNTFSDALDKMKSFSSYKTDYIYAVYRTFEPIK